MNRKSGLILTVLVSLLMAACTPKKTEIESEGTTTSLPTDTIDQNANNAYDTGYSAEALASQFGINGDPLNYKVLYFQYNSSNLEERSRIIAKRHAEFLGQSGGTRVNLEGHADERGTRDFNLALGERRAQTVSQYMSSVGANSSIQTISYGEERPADAAHNEAAWQVNRRVEVKY
jgi:peptidoglycan-associated lipoprotein